LTGDRYYDNLRCENGDPSAATWVATWSDSSAKGFGKCENTNTSIQKPFSYYKSNQFVGKSLRGYGIEEVLISSAIDLSLFATADGYQKYCGKK
jgi:hypothetical protein